MAHLTISNGKKGFLVILFLLSFLPMKAQVMWNLKGGIMQRSYHDEYTYWYESGREKRLDWMAGLELEIPLSEKLNLETGLRYKDHYSLAYDEDEYEMYHSISHLELPLRLTYKYPLGKHFKLHAGIGPYASYALGEMGYGNSNFQVGLEPSVAINWACLSLGTTYNFPCFYNGFKDKNNPAVMLTLGIRFKSKAWKYIGAGLLTVATVGAAVGMAYSEATGSSSGYSSNSYSSSSSGSVSNSSNATRSSSASSGTKSGEATHTTAEGQAWRTDSRTYSNYESMLIKMNTYWETQYKDSDRRNYQKKMKDIRTKWEKRGYTITHSEWEDWDGKKR